MKMPAVEYAFISYRYLILVTKKSVRNPTVNPNPLINCDGEVKGSGGMLQSQTAPLLNPAL